MNQSSELSPDRVIAVDLDGTLLCSDLLVEDYFDHVRRRPLHSLHPLGWLLKGKAFLKQRLSIESGLDYRTLPYRAALIDWLKSERAEGSTLVLATASHRKHADGVSNHLKLFDEVIATEHTNLSGESKAQALVARFGERGFEYIGNADEDLAVWRHAAVVHTVGVSPHLLKKASLCAPLGRVIPSDQNRLSALLKLLRLHQWAKNLLILVPLLASHQVLDVSLWMAFSLAFLAFGLCASSVYLLNDLLDLRDDRQHPTKRNRPLAAGTFPIHLAIGLIPFLLGLSFLLALVFLPSSFVTALLVYYAATLAYSLKIKRIVILDVVTLSLLYTIRVIAGATATGLETTFWILAFCQFVFLSLAFLKRYTELKGVMISGRDSIVSGRGYQVSDFELLASLGGSSGYLSVLVLALYIRESEYSGLYGAPVWMWVSCPLLLFWLSRAWLLAHRGEMHDDPIVFALKDPASRLVGVLVGLSFIAATLL